MDPCHRCRRVSGLIAKRQPLNLEEEGNEIGVEFVIMKERDGALVAKVGVLNGKEQQVWRVAEENSIDFDERNYSNFAVKDYQSFFGGVLALGLQILN